VRGAFLGRRGWIFPKKCGSRVRRAQSPTGGGSFVRVVALGSSRDRTIEFGKDGTRRDDDDDDARDDDQWAS
jgi:hypothetical protein